ncbi:hypothetical protein MRX96_049055 [Rhipicephalus microplus]
MKRFFEKKLGPFQAWQVFIMWMAITGLIVYIASLIGFRRTGDVNGTCDDFTSCRGEAECQDGRCACLPPLFVVVDGICSKASREQSVVDNLTQAPKRAPAGFPVVVVEDFARRRITSIQPGVLASSSVIVSPSTMASGMMTAQGRDAPAQASVVVLGLLEA